MSGRLGMGIIGAGAISQLAHLPAAQIAPNVQVVALCDSRRDLAQAVAARYHIPCVYASLDELLANDRVQAVSLCVPTLLHADLAIRALSAGKHVLCEKPMASTVARGAAMVAAAQASGKRLMIGHHKRYDPGCEQAKAVLSDGTIGTPRFVIYQFGTGNWTAPALTNPLVSSEPAAPWSYEYPNGIEEGWARAYYESLLEMFSHITNLLRWFLGDPGWVLDARPAIGPVRGTLTLGWGNGPDIQAFCTDGPHYSANVWNEVVTVWGEEGRIEVALPQNVYVNKPARVRVFEVGTGSDILLPETYGWAFAREVEHFARCINESTPFRTEATDSLKDVVIAETAVRAVAGLCSFPARIVYEEAERWSSPSTL